MAKHHAVLCIFQVVLLCQTFADISPPKLIIVSMDGFRYDYLDRFKESEIDHFRFFIDKGVKAEYVKNVFPTNTFPNHYTILTGLYPESHGIVHNNFYDPDLNDHFMMEEEADNFDPKWFDVGAEPIYVTNKKAGSDKYSGSVMFPTGLAKVNGTGPDYILHKFQDIYNLTGLNATERIDAMMNWFTTPINPINLGLLYFPEPDEIGHEYGPDSTEVNNVIKGPLNQALGYLKKSLEDANLFDSTNIIITSDHGMTTMTSYVNLDDYVNPSWYQEASEWQNEIMVNLIPKKGYEGRIMEALHGINEIYVYKKGSQELNDLHYNDNNRIQEIVVAAKEGGAIFNSDKIANISVDDLLGIHGMHGYRPDIRTMSPFFIAYGPAFKKNFVSKPINSVDIYPLMCHLLDLTPAPNNGSFDNVKQMLA